MATITIPNFLTEKVMVGLNTYQYTIQTAGLHFCKIEVDHPQTSNLTVSITQAGSSSGTLASTTVQPVSNPNTTGQSSVIIQARANCQVGDVLSFVLTSSTANDQQLNTVKSKFRISANMTN